MLPLCLCGVWASAAQPQVLAAAFAGTAWGLVGKQWADIARHASDPKRRRYIAEELGFARYTLDELALQRRSADLDRRLRVSDKLPADARTAVVRQIMAEHKMLYDAQGTQSQELMRLVEDMKARRRAELRELMPPGLPK